MKLADWLLRAQNNLTTDTARLDAELIVGNIMAKDRAWILAHDDLELEATAVRRLNSALGRRKKHEPLAYILCEKEFYGRRFYVNKNVLVPRPESEEIIEQLKKLKLTDAALVADVGCGSGVLGITAALELKNLRVHFLDIDPRAMQVCKRNARLHKLKKQQYYLGDLLEAWPDTYDALLCNLPYVPEDYPVNEDVQHEPKLAIFSGKDGLDHYRRLFEQLKTEKFGNPIVIAESLIIQHQELINVAKSAKYKLVSKKDLVLVFRRFL